MDRCVCSVHDEVEWFMTILRKWVRN